MLLEHIGFEDIGGKLHKSLDICGQYERKVVMTGRDTGATSQEYGDYVMSTVENANVDSIWQNYVEAQS